MEGSRFQDFGMLTATQDKAAAAQELAEARAKLAAHLAENEGRAAETARLQAEVQFKASIHSAYF